MPQKMRLRVPYGVASQSRIGGLSDIFTGQIMTPSFTAGDAKITQDDGTGVDDLDTLPSLDGTDVLLSISAAEATAISANGRNRTIQLYDQGTKAWVDLDIIIETEGNSHLATFPNGVIYGFTPTAIGAGTFTGVSAMQTGVNPLWSVAVVYASDEPLDIGAVLVVDGWTAGTQIGTGSAGWTRTPTGTLSSLRISLYANPKDACIALINAQHNLATSDILTTLATYDGAYTGTIATDAGNSALTFKVSVDVSSDVRVGFLRLTSGGIAGESRLVKHTGTQVTILSDTDMPTELKQYSATPADAVTWEFRPLR